MAESPEGLHDSRFSVGCHIPLPAVRPRQRSGTSLPQSVKGIAVLAQKCFPTVGCKVSSDVADRETSIRPSETVRRMCLQEYAAPFIAEPVTRTGLVYEP